MRMPPGIARPVVLGSCDPKAPLGFRLLVCKMGRLMPALGGLRRLVGCSGRIFVEAFHKIKGIADSDLSNLGPEPTLSAYQEQ